MTKQSIIIDRHGLPRDDNNIVKLLSINKDNYYYIQFDIKMQEA